MKSTISAAYVCALTISASAFAQAPDLPHYPRPETRFSDALDAEQLSRESFLNMAFDADLLKAAQEKGNAQTKANVSIYGSIVNDNGSPLCGLVLANGQFMFSCSPNGTYSLTVPQDGAGQVTLFGFVDGHFPYKRVFGGSGGRYDMTLNIARITPPPPPPVTYSTLRWTITDGCNNGISIRYKFYDVDNNLVWPSSTTYWYTEYFGATYSHNLTCRTGAKICFGARAATTYWGVDLDGTQSCATCCTTCRDASVADRLTC